MRFIINFLVILVFGFFLLIIGSNSNMVHAQCDSKITAKAKSTNDVKGDIIVEITTTGSFICRLNNLSGKGTETLERNDIDQINGFNRRCCW